MILVSLIAFECDENERTVIAISTLRIMRQRSSEDTEGEEQGAEGKVEFTAATMDASRLETAVVPDAAMRSKCFLGWTHFLGSACCWKTDNNLQNTCVYTRV